MLDKEPNGIPIDIEVPLPLLRSRLNKLTSRIVFKLEDRSGFSLNPTIYQPGAIPLSDGSKLSFFEYAIKGLEEYHGTLGRWEYPDEYPLMISTKPTSITRRTGIGLPILPSIDINVRDKLLPFYTDSFLPKLCDSKDDPGTYGETAYIDADIVELLNERINLGRFVAASKVYGNPDIWRIVSDTEKLTEALRDRDREEVVIKGALDEASKVELDQQLTKDIFRWVIERTMDVEVTYLQGIPQPNMK